MKRYFNEFNEDLNYKVATAIIKANIKDGETWVLVDKSIKELSDKVISDLPIHTFYETSGTSSDAVLTAIEIKNDQIIIHGQISDSPIYMSGEEVAFGIEDIQGATYIKLFESLSELGGVVIPRDLDLLSMILIYVNNKIYLVNRSIEVRPIEDPLMDDDELTLYELMDISTEMESGESYSINITDYSQFETVNMSDRKRVEEFLNKKGK